ncbi:hypothetical protein ACFQT0_08730 [Hymenobacter humi]|uniref:TonB C-terminal domain-containing protein n=1 Tax=Hymenobacter humi TaxID=1411620 RepID=A0ABW2U1W3_9BACT
MMEFMVQTDGSLTDARVIKSSVPASMMKPCA